MTGGAGRPSLADFCLTYPETDHEAQRAKARHPGFLPEAAAGTRPGDAGCTPRSRRAAAAGTEPRDQATLDVVQVRPSGVVTFGQTPQSFLFGSISGSWVAFALFGGIACFVGGATTAILRRFAARPEELPYYATTPAARRTLGVVIGSAILVAVWWWLWSGFYQLEAGHDAITLQFHMPLRERIVPRREIVNARWDAGARSSRVLVVETRSGKSYRSMQTSSNEAFERRVTQALAAREAR